MSNENNANILISVPVKLREDFKTWCHEQGISANHGFRLMMREITKGRFVLRTRIKEKTKR